MTALEPLAVISAFLSDGHTPAFSLQPVATVRKATDSMPMRNVICLSLLKIGWRRLEKACRWKSLFVWLGKDHPRTAWYVA